MQVISEVPVSHKTSCLGLPRWTMDTGAIAHKGAPNEDTPSVSARNASESEKASGTPIAKLDDAVRAVEKAQRIGLEDICRAPPGIIPKAHRRAIAAACVKISEELMEIPRRRPDQALAWARQARRFKGRSNNDYLLAEAKHWIQSMGGSDSFRPPTNVTRTSTGRMRYCRHNNDLRRN